MKNALRQFYAKFPEALKNRYSSYLQRRFGNNKYASYSQSGEDRIVELLRKLLELGNLYYLDIGAGNPIHGSNTYLFYKTGSRGVCVEADPVRCESIRRVRPNDLCLNLGIGEVLDQSKKKFYVMGSRAFSTFSEARVKEIEKSEDFNVEKIEEINVSGLNEIITNHCSSMPNFVSMDIEGMDETVIRSFDFSKCSPEIFCIETLEHTSKKSRKSHEIIEHMLNNGYFIFADTYINTIFAKLDTWLNVCEEDPPTIYAADTPH